MKYLCVDDEELQLAKLISSVKEADPKGEIIAFSNPVSVMDFIKNNHDIDVAFLDISLPEISGIEIAKAIKERDPKTNIIFATAYTEYALDAHTLHASGYLTKPITAEAVKIELKNLRYPIPHDAEKKILKAECFGNFEIFKDDLPILFARSKSKELLAYLIYCNGAIVSTSELSKVLFNEDKSSYVRNLISDITKALERVGAKDVFVKRFNGAGVNTSLIDCDYYDYLNNEIYAIKKYRGEFMKPYKWAKFKK